MRSKFVQALVPTVIGSLFTIAFLIEPAHAENILECTTRAREYGGRFILTDTGTFRLKARKLNQEFECDLSLDDYNYAPDAVVANLTLRMSPVNCRKPDQSEYVDRTLSKDMILVVKKGAKDKYEADVFWVTYLQPSIYKLEKYNREGVIRSAEKYKKGTF